MKTYDNKQRGKWVFPYRIGIRGLPAFTAASKNFLVQRAFSVVLLSAVTLTASTLFGQEPTKEEIEKLGRLLEEVAEAHVDTATKFTDLDEAREFLSSMSWDRLLGESLVSANQEFSLWSTAVDSFTRSDSAWKIGQDEQNKSLLKELMGQERVMAMRYDVVEALKRKDQVAEQNGETTLVATARGKEKERIDQLRRLAVSYSTMIHQMSVADYAIETGSLGIATEALEESVKQSDKIIGLVANRSSNPDYYLFENEPEILTGESTQFALNVDAPRPIKVGVVPRVRSLQALSLYRLATRGGIVGDPRRREQQKEVLSKAIESARLALGSGIGDAADDSIAELAWGWSALALGIFSSLDRPFDKTAADNQYFRQSLEHLENAIAGLPEGSGMSNRLKQLVNQLEAPESFVLACISATSDGNLNGALQVMRQAVVRHRDEATWRLYFETRMRAGADISAIRGAFEQVFDNPSSPEVALLDSKIAIEEAWHVLSEKELVELSPRERAESASMLTGKFDELYAMLAPTGMLAADDRLRARFEATSANLLHLANIFAPSQRLDKRFFALVEDSRVPLENQVKGISQELERAEAGSTEEQLLLQDLYSLREARIGLYLALGNVSAKYLIRDGKHVYEDAMVGYQAAFDEIGSLPFAVNRIQAFGSPMLEGLQVIENYDEDGTQILARDERARRVEMENVFQAAFSMQFAPSVASSNSDRRVDQSRESNGASARKAFLELSALGQEDDERKIKAFALLVRIKGVYAKGSATEQEIATRKVFAKEVYQDALKLAQIPQDLLSNDGVLNRRHLLNVDETIIAYLLCKAIDCRVAAFAISELPQEKANLIRSFGVARDRVQEIVSRRSSLREKFVELLADLETTSALYSGSPVFSHEYAARTGTGSLSQYDLTVSRLASALKRKPSSKSLWERYLQAQLKNIRAKQGNQLDREMLTELADATKNGLVANYDAEFYRGLILEEMREFTNAIAAQRSSALFASTEQDLLPLSERDEVTARFLQASAKAIELEIGR
ncbi:MAG: hypothetical protein AAF483_02220 [Planctomycetota bacterium]